MKKVELSADEQRIIFAYRAGKAVKAVNLLKAQGDLPASFPERSETGVQAHENDS